MNIDWLVNTDKNILLQLNGSDSLFWDYLMTGITSTVAWIPVAIALLFVIIKNNTLRESGLIILCIALTILIADQFTSSFCKPFFARFRPAQDPIIMYMVDVVDGYRGGRYGFVSSHAANTFGLAVFLTLLIRSKGLSFILFIWASLNAYSRIYLGVHYPGDILFGTLDGVIVGFSVYYLYRFFHKKCFITNRYISNQYTSTGYLVNDINLLIITFIFTCMIIIVWSIIQANILYF
jgi:undecaprenyl-diphosphatase